VIALRGPGQRAGADCTAAAAGAPSYAHGRAHPRRRLAYAQVAAWGLPSTRWPYQPPGRRRSSRSTPGSH